MLRSSARRFSVSTVAALAVTLLVVGSRPSSAAAPPPTLPPEVTTSNAPSPADVDLIVAYCKDGVSRLGSGDFREVEKARDFLLAPLNLPGVTGAFRHAYTKALFSRPIDILRYIDGPQPHPRINAFRVIENLGTGDALDAMVERADSSRRPSLDVGGRLWAARAAGTILRSTRNSDVIVPSKISKAVRALGSAAEREPDVNVLRRQFDALGAVNTTEARNELVGALDRVITRLRQNTGPSPLIEAVQRALLQIRTVYLTLPSNEKASLSGPLAACLTNVLDLAHAHWDAAHGDSTFKTAYGRASQLAEQMLETIRKVVRGSGPNFTNDVEAIWSANDRPGFEARKRQWKGIFQIADP